MRNSDSKSAVGKAFLFGRRGRLVILGLIVLLILSAGFLIVIRSIIDGDRVADALLSDVKAQTHKEVEYASSSLSWVSLARFQVTIKDIVCRENASSPILFRIPSTVFDVSLLPILWGTASFERAVISQPVFFLPSSSDNRPAKRFLTGPAPVSRLSFLRLRVDSLLIEGGKVVLGMHGKPSTAQVQNLTLMAIDIRGSRVKTVQITAEIISDAHKGYVEIIGNALSNPFEGGSTGSLNVQLSKAPLATLRSLLAYFGMELPFSTGTLDLKAGMNGVGDSTKVMGTAVIDQATLLPVEVFHQETVLPHAALGFSVQFSRTDIQIHINELSLPGANVVAKISADGIETRDPRLRIDLGKASLELAYLFPFIPVKLMNQEDREKLLESRLKGKILITGGSWTGKFSELVNKDRSIGRLVLYVILDGVSGYIPAVGLTLREGFGSIRLERSAMVMERLSLLVGASTVSINGRVWELSSVPQLDLALTAKGEIEEFRGLWENRVLTERLTTRLGSIKELKGTIDASVAVKGSTSQPKLNGHAQFNGLRCRFSKLPLPVSRFEGSIEFRGSNYSVSSVKGFIGESSVAIAGTVSQNSLNLRANLQPASSDLKKLKWLPSHSEFTGKIPLEIKLGGTWSEMTVESAMDLKKNGLRIGGVIAKKPGIPLTITASGIRSAKDIKVTSGSIILAKSTIKVKGRLDSRGRISVSVNLPPRGLPTDSLKNIVDSAFQVIPGGRIEGRAAIRTGPKMPSDLRMDVDLKCANLSMRIPRINGLLEGFTGIFACRGQSVSAVIKEAKIGKSQLTGKCSIEGFDSPKIVFALRMPFFDTTDFDHPEGSKSGDSWRERKRSSPVVSFLGRSQITGLVVAPKGRMFDRAFSDLEVGFEGRGGIVKIPKWQMNAAGGRVEGSGLFDIRSETQELLRVDVRGDGLAMERVLTAGGQESVLEGRTKAEGWMAWKTGPAGKDNGTSRQGFFQVEISGGKIQRFEILSKIFSLINIGSLVRGKLPDVMSTGLPFQKLTWKMDLTNNKWMVKDLRLASDTATIDASGMYVIDQKKMNFKVQVAPLVGVDKILSTVVGKLLKRDVKTLTTTFRVRGSYPSPDIRLIPLETLKSSQD